MYVLPRPVCGCPWDSAPSCRPAVPRLRRRSGCVGFRAVRAVLPFRDRGGVAAASASMSAGLPSCGFGGVRVTAASLRQLSLLLPVDRGAVLCPASALVRPTRRANSSHSEDFCVSESCGNRGCWGKKARRLGKRRKHSSPQGFSVSGLHDAGSDRSEGNRTRVPSLRHLFENEANNDSETQKV